MRLRGLKRTLVIALATLAFGATNAVAATPPAGTITPSSGPITWQGAFYPLAGNVYAPGGTPTCEGDPGAVPGVNTCDVFELTVNVPTGYWSTHHGGVSIDIEWGDSNNDFDMFVYRKPGPGEPLGNPINSSAEGGTTEESVKLFNPEGTYLVRIDPYTVTASDYKGSVRFFDLQPIPDVAGGLDQFRASHDQYNSHSEPFIALNPLNPSNLVAGSKQYQNLEGYKFKIGTYASSDGGRTWRDNGHLPGYPVQTGNEGDNYYVTSDIWHAFDDEGNAYSMVLDNPPGSPTGAGWGMTLHKSTDGGKTWGGRIPIEEKSDPVTKAGFLADKNALVVDNYGPDRDGKTGNMYACWSEDNAQANLAVALKKSTDAGKTWGDKQFISGADRTVLGCFPVVAPPKTAGHPGDVYVFWLDFSMQRIRMAKSTDGGDSWSVPSTVQSINRVDGFPNSPFRNDSLPTAGVDPADGTLYVAWDDLHQTKPDELCPPDPDAPAGQICDSDILLTKSKDGGDTWSDPVKVNRDTLGNGKDQFQPQMTVTPGGQVDVMWFDRRNDPQDFYIDTFFGRSNDKGATWHETRVTKKMWDPSVNPPISTSGQFIGDYQGIAASDCSAVPFWNDTTASQLPTSDPAYSKWQEVYSAIVPNSTAFGGPVPGGDLPKSCKPSAIAHTPLALGGRFVISGRRVKMTRKRVIGVRVSCRTPLHCAGRLGLRIKRRSIGSAKFTIPTRTRNLVIKVRTSRKTFALVQRLRKTRVVATADVRIGSDIRGRVSKSFKLYRAFKPRKKR
jgi:hypothetical protein